MRAALNFTKSLFSVVLMFLALGATAPGFTYVFADASGSLGETRASAESFKHIVLDLRGSRGGHGDVAASYLTALDLLKRHKYQGQMTFVVDDDSLRILGKLTGQRIRSGQSLFGGKIQVYDGLNIPKDLVPADLYLSLASPSGVERFSGNFRLAGSSRPVSPSQFIPIHDRTVRITQTVLGNTENPHSRNPFGLLRIGEEKFRLSPAGLASNESGMYFDPVARSLKGKRPDQVREFVLSSLGHNQDSIVRDLIGDVLSKRTFVGSQTGLVYGITAKQVKDQFEEYLSGLAKQSTKSGKSFTLLTPSGFNLSDVRDSRLRSLITVIEKGTPVPLKAVPGRIYVVKTGTLPHRTFVGLMALSEIPPVVAGDGALSAAISLERPFVMTSVGWNERNIANIQDKLLAGSSVDPDLGETFRKVYPKGGLPDLSVAQQLRGRSGPYAELSSKASSLTDHLLASAQSALTSLMPVEHADDLIASIADPALRESVEEKLIARIHREPGKIIHQPTMMRPGNAPEKIGAIAHSTSNENYETLIKEMMAQMNVNITGQQGKAIAPHSVSFQGLISNGTYSSLDFKGVGATKAGQGNKYGQFSDAFEFKGGGGPAIHGKVADFAGGSLEHEKGFIPKGVGKSPLDFGGMTIGGSPKGLGHGTATAASYGEHLDLGVMSAHQKSGSLNGVKSSIWSAEKEIKKVFGVDLSTILNTFAYHGSPQEKAPQSAYGQTEIPSENSAAITRHDRKVFGKEAVVIEGRVHVMYEAPVASTDLRTPAVEAAVAKAASAQTDSIHSKMLKCPSPLFKLIGK